jgi:LPXTG-site transpeptidase (sortase) family protein
VVRRGTRWLAGVAMLVGLAGCGGGSAEEPAAAPTPAASSAAAPTTAAPTTPVPTTPSVPVQDGALGPAGPAAPAPVRLELPSLGVRAAVRPVGVDRAGELEVPEDVAEVGWYRFGPRPGDAGSAVLSGHINSAEQGPGAFVGLSKLKVGDPVTVTTGDGKTRRYRVTATKEWPKSEVPLDTLFDRSGPARLTLVTCGGGFREDVRSYKDNIAVTAVPVG